MQRKQIIICLFLLPMLFQGCAAVLVGGGAAGGYAISKDSVEGIVDGKKQDLYKQAFDVAGEYGVVTLQDRNTGLIEFLSEEIKVKINIEQVTPGASRIKVAARKNLLPKVQKAQEIYTAVLKEVS